MTTTDRLLGPTAAGVILGGYLVALVTYVAVRGVPFEREQVILLATTGVVLVALARGDRADSVLRALRDWLVLGVLFVAYDYTRGAADTLGMPVWTDVPIDIDRAVFGEVPTVWLQDRLGPFRGDRWWEVVVSIAYASHFIVPYVVTAALWLTNRQRWRAWIATFSALTLAGLATYVLAPTTPPWLASRNGHLPRLQRSAGTGWQLLDLEIADRVISKGQGAVNLIAALPSLHAAYALLVSVMLWPWVRGRWRPLLVAYPLVMGFSLVVSAEHYVFDVVVGWLYVVGVVAAWRRTAAHPRVAAWVARP